MINVNTLCLIGIDLVLYIDVIETMHKQCRHINLKFCDVNQQIPRILPTRKQITLNKVITNRDPSRFKEGS